MRRRQLFTERWIQKHLVEGIPHFVYILYDVQTGQVGYIGKTIDPPARLYQHRLDHRRGWDGRRDRMESSQKIQWMEALTERGSTWEFEVFGLYPNDTMASIAEFALIQKYDLHNTVHRWKGAEVHSTGQIVFLPEDTIPFE